MKNKIKALFVGVLMLAAAIAISAGDVLFQDGGMNISEDLLVSTNTLYVDSAEGKVGIGISAPTRTLDVNGDVKIGTNLGIGVGGTSTVAITALLGGNGLQTLLRLVNNDPATTNDGVRILMQGSSGFSTMAHIDAGWSNSSTDNSYLAFTVRDDNSIEEKVRISSQGNLGIGTTSPGSKLHVVGELNVSGVSGDGTGKVVCIKSDGNMGTCSDQPGAGGTCTCG